MHNDKHRTEQRQQFIGGKVVSVPFNRRQAGMPHLVPQQVAAEVTRKVTVPNVTKRSS